MPTILLYFALALIVMIGVIIAVPDDKTAPPTQSPLEVMRELNK